MLLPERSVCCRKIPSDPCSSVENGQSCPSRLGSDVSTPRLFAAATVASLFESTVCNPMPRSAKALRNSAKSAASKGYCPNCKMAFAPKKKSGFETKWFRREENAAAQFPSSGVIRRPSWIPLTLTDTGMIVRQIPQSSPMDVNYSMRSLSALLDIDRLERKVGLQHIPDDRAGRDGPFSAVVDARHHGDFRIVVRGVGSIPGVGGPGFGLGEVAGLG